MAASLKTLFRTHTNDSAACIENWIRPIVLWKRWPFSVEARKDLIQSVTMEALRLNPNHFSDTHFEHTIQQLTFRRCIDELRRFIALGKKMDFDASRRMNEGDTDCISSLTDNNNPFLQIAEEEKRKALQSSIVKLGNPCRGTILDFYMEGLTYNDLAKKNGVSINTIGSRLSRCLERLRLNITNHPVFSDVA